MPSRAQSNPRPSSAHCRPATLPGWRASGCGPARRGGVGGQHTQATVAEPALFTQPAAQAHPWVLCTLLLSSVPAADATCVPWSQESWLLTHQEDGDAERAVGPHHMVRRAAYACAAAAQGSGRSKAVTVWQLELSSVQCDAHVRSARDPTPCGPHPPATPHHTWQRQQLHQQRCTGGHKGIASIRRQLQKGDGCTGT